MNFEIIYDVNWNDLLSTIEEKNIIIHKFNKIFDSTIEVKENPNFEFLYSNTSKGEFYIVSFIDDYYLLWHKTLDNYYCDGLEGLFDLFKYLKKKS